MKKHKLLYTFEEIERETERDWNIHLEQLKLQGNYQELINLRQTLMIIRDEIDNIMSVDIDIKIQQVIDAQEYLTNQFVKKILN